MRGGAQLCWIGLVVVAGCFDPHPPPGQACAPGDLCPAGLVCDNGFCVEMPGQADAPVSGIDACVGCADGPPVIYDARIDGSAVVDTDGDTVPDSTDNCVAIPNLTQHNEDGDAAGDVCDNCPHLNVAFTDGDGDGVGDACDPSPAAGGDSIARFISFEGGMPVDLTTTGTWTTFNNDAVRTTSTTGRILIPGSRTIVTAEMGGTVETAQSTSRELKIVTARTAGNQWHSCCFDDTDGTSVFTFEIENENSGAGTLILNTPEPTRPTRIDVGAFYIRNTADANAHTVTCAAMEGGSPIVTNAAAPALTAGQVEVISSRVSFTLNYILILGHT